MACVGQELFRLVGSLHLFHAGWSSERYWRGTSSPEEGERGTRPNATVPPLERLLHYDDSSQEEGERGTRPNATVPPLKRLLHYDDSAQEGKRGTRPNATVPPLE